MADEDLTDPTGAPITDDLGILKVRQERVAQYFNDLFFLINKKGEAPTMFKFKDGTTENLCKTVEDKPGQYDKAILETKAKILEEAGKL